MQLAPHHHPPRSRGGLRRSALLSLLVPWTAGAAAYSVGPGRTYSSPCALAAAVALAPGDVVEVDPGTYGDTCQLTASGTASAPITLRGPPGPMPVFSPPAGTDLSGAGSVPRAIFQFTGGSYWVVQHLELKNAWNTSANGAAFRLTAGAHDILIEDVSVHDCQDGMMSDGPATLTVQNSDIFHNGAGDGYSHNFYLQGDSAILIGNHIHDSNGGQNVKLRSRYAALFYNLVENAGQYEMDLIQGPDTSNANANAVLVGNVIARPSASGNDNQVILFGTDDATQAARNGSLYAVNNTFVLKNSANHLFHAIQPVAGSQIVFENNIVFATAAGTALAADATTAGILSGSHNWVGSNVTLAGTLAQTFTGTDPGFIGATDYHLQAGAPVIDQGLAHPTYVDGSGITQSAVPTEEFSAPQGTAVRPAQAMPDLGAFEAASTDGGTSGSPDGGADGGAADGGGLDAGGVPDAGSTPDGGPGAVGGIASSCGCSEASGPSLLSLLIAACAALRHRRPASQGG